MGYVGYYQQIIRLVSRLCAEGGLAAYATHFIWGGFSFLLVTIISESVSISHAQAPPRPECRADGERRNVVFSIRQDRVRFSFPANAIKTITSPKRKTESDIILRHDGRMIVEFSPTRQLLYERQPIEIQVLFFSRWAIQRKTRRLNNDADALRFWEFYDEKKEFLNKLRISKPVQVDINSLINFAIRLDMTPKCPACRPAIRRFYYLRVNSGMLSHLILSCHSQGCVLNGYVKELLGFTAYGLSRGRRIHFPKAFDFQVAEQLNQFLEKARMCAS